GLRELAGHQGRVLMDQTLPCEHLLTMGVRLLEQMTLRNGVAQRLQHGFICRAGQDRGMHLFADAGGLAHQSVLLAVEVVEEGARGDADGIGDVLDGDVLDAVLLGKGQGGILQGTPSVLLLAFPPPERRGNLSRCFCHICSLCIIAATAKMSGCDMCDKNCRCDGVRSPGQGSSPRPDRAWRRPAWPALRGTNRDRRR